MTKIVSIYTFLKKRMSLVNFKYVNRLTAVSIILLLSSFMSSLQAQPVPAIDENIPYLVTFGKDSDPLWGDDDFCQIFFFVIPESRVDPVYLRVYDPDAYGDNDEVKHDFNTATKFSIYGGTECWSNKDAQGVDPINNYKSGVLITSRVFKSSPEYHEKWFTFEPINPFEGELVEKFNGKVFKVIAEGLSGDDGNLYKYYLSSKPNENKPVEGGNFFTYEYTFRLANNKSQVSQIYPYIDDKTTSVKIWNFDWDNDGQIKVNSVAKNRLNCGISSDGDWSITDFPIVEEEKNTSLEVQFLKNQSSLVKNNNVGLIIQNQYGISLPFYVIPIGGVPVYAPKIRMIEVD